MASGNKPEPKRLVVCCDGTWNTPEMESPTNVVRLVTNVLPRGEDGMLQLLYYDEGVGTGGWLDRIMGGAFGEGLDVNVREAYRFLASNYAEGDEIYLFGFSRGSYTVRSLSGMVSYAGLLGRSQLTWTAEAYELYREEKSADGEKATKFRSKHFTQVPAIALLGCWDTVGALGFPDKLPGIPLDRAFRNRYRWIDFNLGAHVKTALHAVSIDERRKEFKHTPMRKGTPDQVLHEVWFAGDHGCVGGGSPHKEPLSRIALEWMVDSARELGLGLAVKPGFDGLRDADRNIYFSRNRSPIYGQLRRDMGADPVVHESAVGRYKDLPHYRQSLGKSQQPLLGKAAQHGPASELNLYSKGTVLGVGGTAHVVVYAHKQHNDTKIDVVEGAQYKFSVAKTQCWRDGDLPPCDAAGWRLGDEAVQSALGRFGKWRQPLIRLARSRRVVPDADWFELVAILRGADGEEEKLRVGLEKWYTASFDGRLLALANDVQSRIGFLDRYDNNEGWVVVEVARTA